MKNLLKLSLVAVVVIALGYVGYEYPKLKPSLGAVPGNDFLESVALVGGATIGSNCYATTTTGTMIPSVLEKNSCIRIAATGAGQGTISLTLPASSTLSNIITRKGACRDWWIDNSDVAAATTTTVVAGTGVDLVGLDATGAGTGADVIDGLEFGVLRLCRQQDGDIVGFVQEWIHAD